MSNNLIKEDEWPPGLTTMSLSIVHKRFQYGVLFSQNGDIKSRHMRRRKKKAKLLLVVGSFSHVNHVKEVPHASELEVTCGFFFCRRLLSSRLITVTLRWLRNEKRLWAHIQKSNLLQE